ncbi:MAG TPA: cation transporter [Acidimicrobiales bacterium]|nr:cation transporter [Acidimicrobiales bacterium]
MDTASGRALPAGAPGVEDGHDHDHGGHDRHGHDHAVEAPPASAGRTGPARDALVRRAQRLNVITLGWNLVEGVVALGAGIAAGSISLIGFGLDSGIEVSAALILAWRLGRERRGGCMQEDDRLATRAIAVSFAALAVYVAAGSLLDLVTGARPEASVPGVVLAALSLSAMPALARAKRRLAPALGSRAVEADAAQTNLCALLSAVLLFGLAANAALGWRWADPAAGLAIAALAAAEATRTWRAESLADTCCP